MGIVINQSFKNSIYFYIGMLFGATSVVVFYPNVFYDHPEHLGLYQIIVASSTIITTFSYLGAPRILIRFFPKVEDKNQLISLTFIIPLIGFFLFSVFYLLFKDVFFSVFNADELFKQNFHFVFILVLLFSFYEVLSSLSRSLLNATVPIFLKEIFLKGTFLILLTLHWTDLISFNTFLYMYTSLYFIMILFLSYRISKEFRYVPTLSFNNIEYIKIVRYGIYVVVGGSSAMIVSKIDMMMLAHIMNDLSHVAYYAIPFFIGNVVLVPSRAIASIASPLIANAWEKNNIQQIYDIYVKSALHQLLFGGIIFLIIWINIDDGLSLLPDKFNGEGVKLVIFFIGISKLFNVATGVNGQIIINSKHYRFDLYSNLFLMIITLITNYIFIQTDNPLSEYKIYGIAGAAFATALSVFLFNFIKMIYVFYILRFHPFTMQTIKLLIILFFVYFSCYFLDINSSNIYFNIIFRCIILFGLLVPLVLFSRVSKDINTIILEFWNKYIIQKDCA